MASHVLLGAFSVLLHRDFLKQKINISFFPPYLPPFSSNRPPLPQLFSFFFHRLSSSPRVPKASSTPQSVLLRTLDIRNPPPRTMTLPTESGSSLGKAKPISITNKMAESEEGELSSSPSRGRQQPASAPVAPSSQLIVPSENDHFPRYSTTPNYSIPQHRTSLYPPKAPILDVRGGPAPQKGTPQDRFRTAVLGIGEAPKPTIPNPHASATFPLIPSNSRAFNTTMNWGNMPPSFPPSTVFGGNVTHPLPQAWTTASK